MVLSQQAISQNYYNSPYTRFEIGDLINTGFAYNKAMGGSSIALRPQNQINYLNPASYTSQDTNSFLFQTGLTGRYAKVSSEYDDGKSLNFNIDYVAIGFPVTKWWSASIGVTPFSRIQYNLSEDVFDPSIGESMTYEYKGFGGLNEFYLGTAFEIKNMLSVGANAGYIFGTLDRKQSSYLTEYTAYSALISHSTNYIAGDFYFKLGAQFYPVIKEKHKFVLGVTYDVESNIDVKEKASTMRYNTTASISTGQTPYTDSLNYRLDTLQPFVLPAKIGLGFSYTYNDILTVTGEYIKQDWTGTEIVSSAFRTNIYESYRFGIEYTPASVAERNRVGYLKRMNYRIGGDFTNNYIAHSSGNISSKGLSVGVGFPVKNYRKMFTGTTFNIGYNYGQRGKTEDRLIKENYHIITFGLTLHDFWFLKPKYD